MARRPELGPRERMMELPDGRRVGLAEYGDLAGRPVLALHGAPASRLMFSIADRSAQRLGLRLIAPDRPGYGLTPLQRAPRTLTGIAADMQALTDALGLGRVGLIGISGGAPYAVAIAARMGRRVAALALVSPLGPLADLAGGPTLARGHRWFFLTLPRHRPALAIGAAAAALVFRLAPGVLTTLLARLIGRPDRETLSRPAARAAVIAMTEEALRTGSGGAVADLEAYGAPWGIDLSLISAPTLIWQGTGDAVVPPAAAFRLASQIPGCRLIRIDGGGHFWVLDHVDEVLGALSDAMDSGPQPS